MDVAENVAAGLLLAVLLGLARWVSAWWRWRRNTPRISPDPLESLMGKPLPKPDPVALRGGARQQLNDLLHELHSRANYPSPFAIARVLGVSRTTLHDAMSKPKLPSKDIAVRLALAYGSQIRWGPKADPDDELDRIDRRVSELWETAYRERALPDPEHVRRVVQEVWDDLASGCGPYPPDDPVTEALARSTISVSTSGHFVFVIVDTRDRDDRITLGCAAEGSFCFFPWKADLAAETRFRLAPVRISVFEVNLSEDVGLVIADGFLHPVTGTDPASPPDLA
ncbi:TPR repeat-containing protein (plasmid) [Streptomyces hygroscopicus subsp. jinggangensis 5008]|nr:TPR repeat-containing protein [Streptomyces hygroscopicus subsp. jinggangensis 5008]AGF68432.1 TPR repeat-containing protein [Streptomyces hygroscopicus subsp. jinggangensis TL01]